MIILGKDNKWWNDFLKKDNFPSKEVGKVVEFVRELRRSEELGLKTDTESLLELRRLIDRVEKTEENKELGSQLNKLIKDYEKKREREVSEDFGKYLRRVRQNKGLTLAEAAKLTNVSASYLNRLELAQRNSPSIIIIERLAMGLDIPFYELAQKTGIDLGEQREVGVPANSIGELLKTNDISINNMGPMLTDIKKDELIDVISYISNSPWGDNPKEETKTLVKLVDKYRE